MSGPIVRKYGFPNFDEIFGKKEPQHGIEEPQKEAPAEPAKEETPAQGKSRPDKKNTGK